MIFPLVNQTRISIILIIFSISFLTSSKIEATLLPNVFMNEIHYDNAGGDKNEFVELAGNAGIDLFGWSLHFYNGSNGKKYKTFTISESTLLADEVNGFGFSGFNISGIQNGSPDGIVLVDAEQNIIQFLSYEGFFTAVDGIASGLISSNIGVVESPGSSEDYSLQLMGLGNKYDDFTWGHSQINTFGTVNYEQNFKLTSELPISVDEPSSFLFFILVFVLLSQRLIIPCIKQIELMNIVGR